MDPGHTPADARLRPHRFAYGAGGGDGGKCPRLLRLRRRRRARDQPGPHARRHTALLVYRGDRLVVLALLCPPPRFGDSAYRRYDPGADRLRTIPARNPQTTAHRRRARVHRHSPLEHHSERLTFLRAGTHADTCRLVTRLV